MRLLHRIAAVTAASVVVGCAIVTHPYGFDVGVDLEPLAPGWRDNLEMKPYATPGQFVWREGPYSVEIANWTHSTGPTYFMVYVRNKGHDDARIRIRRASESDPPPGLGAFGVFGPGRAPGHGDRVDECAWIDLAAGGSVQFWITDLEWLSEPAVGDQVSCVVDFDGSAPKPTCPVAFRVARVWRKQ